MKCERGLFARWQEAGSKDCEFILNSRAIGHRFTVKGKTELMDGLEKQ